ncbi:GNAT family N-acetyltransferase [Clostridium sp. CTA-19]
MEMKPNESIELIPVKVETKHILENLMTLYLHDLSEFADDLKININGKFEYDGVDLYITQDELKPFFIYLEDDIVGFILLNTGRYVPKGVDFVVNEFFILKTFRRKGISTLAIKKLFDNNKGKYKIGQLANNKIAIHFWKKFYKIQEIEYKESIEIVDGFECYSQLFYI